MMHIRIHTHTHIKLVYISGTLKIHGSEPYVVCLVQPVNPPSILEVRSEGNVFTMHYTMEMKCTFYDGRYVV